MVERVWSGLGSAQAQGLACVVCGISLGAATARGPRWRRSVGVVVGRSRTGSVVFACGEACAARAGELAAVLAVPDEALTAAGVAFVAALDAAGGDVRVAYPNDLVAAVVWAAAPLVVAAELRRLAGHLDSGAGLLRQRAGQLDPAGGGGS